MLRRHTWRGCLLFGLVILVFQAGVLTAFPQAPEEPYKFITNYRPSDYIGQPQNWTIAQDHRGMIYVGNQERLMEFDGVGWRAISHPRLRTVRSLAVGKEGAVFVGGVGKFGYLAPNKGGLLEFVSLVDKLPEEEKRFGEVWKTFVLDNYVYFFTMNALFRWNYRKLDVIKPETSFRSYFLCNGKLYVRLDSIGFTIMEGNRFRPIPGGKFFAKLPAFVLLPHENGGLLVGTRYQGIFLYDGQRFTPFITDIDDYLKKNQLYRGIRLFSGDYALATLRGGLVIIDKQGRRKHLFTKASGLLDDNVKHVFQDKHKNLWLPLAYGISYVEYNSPLSIYDDRAGLPHIILSVLRYKGRFYAGTDYGLYAYAEEGAFKPVEGIDQSCWQLQVAGEELLAVTSKGIFQVMESRGKLLLRGRFYTGIASRNDDSRVWAGMKDALCSLSKQEGEWRQERYINLKNFVVGGIIEDGDGNLWLSSLSGDVLKIKFSSHEPLNKYEVIKFDSTHGLPGEEVNVFWAAGKVRFGTGAGLFCFNEKTGGFVPDSLLGMEFADGSKRMFRLTEADDRSIWFHAQRRNYWAVPYGDSVYKIARRPLAWIPLQQTNAIFPEKDSTWFATSNGLIRFDKLKNKKYELPYSPHIRQVTVNGEPYYHGEWAKYPGGAGGEPVFPFSQRSFRFQVAAPAYEGAGRTQYRFFLEGYESGWSDYTLESARIYTNLDAGFYCFKVQARNVHEVESAEDMFRFRILPPWYLTWWAYSLYLLLAVVGIFSLVKWRSGKLEREKRRLEKTVLNRTEEINQKNRQLERQTVQLVEQAEKLKDLDRVKSRFFANISHEFRTPLTLIMGPMEQMMNGASDPAEAERLRLMHHNSQRLLTLINQLLDLSRFDSGKMRLQAAPQNIVSFLKGLVESFRMLTKQQQLELTFETPRDEVVLYYDAAKLEEVICNLLLNAVKFTPANGAIAAGIRPSTGDAVKEDDFPEGFLEIFVKDSGIGIPKEQLPHIFDRFYQAGEGEKANNKGSGIGLALTREMVALHHGRIDVHSLEGQGTEFIIRLPRGKKHLKREEMIKTPGGEPRYEKVREVKTLLAGVPVDEENTGTGETNGEGLVLVVEDNPGMRKYIRECLEEDFQVVEAANGREGVEKAKELMPDLIISDIMMPEMDGYQLCKSIKGDVVTSHIPVILLTAKASEGSVVEGLETGADDYITKPFNTHILLARIKNLITLRLQLQEKIQRQLRLEPDEIDVSSVDQEFLKELHDVIEKNLSDPEFNVEGLSKKLYMSRVTVNKKIKALTGEAANQFIRSYRLKRAAQLLKAHFGNITEVAFEVGFSSSAYFTKCFKDKFHRLPSDFQAAE